MGPSPIPSYGRSPRPARSRWPRRLGALVAGLSGLVLLTGCSTETVAELKRLGLPEAASTSAEEMTALWIGAWIAAGVIGVFVWGLMAWAVVRYRRRRDDEIPTQVRYNLPIEVLYTVAPFVVIFVLFYHTILAQEAILADEAEGQQEVLVVGHQWSWSFNHLGTDGLDPQGAEGAGDDVFTVGTIEERPTLVLPVDTPVKFTFRSPDVIHSFWVPAFYFKMDVVPGRENTWVTTPTREGTYAGKCAELCGLSHSRMLFDVRVVSPSAYDQHLESLRAAGNIGVVRGSTDTDTIVGDESAEENGAGQ